MALFGRDHDKDKKSDKDGDKAQAAADHDQATEELVDGMLTSSGGDMGRLAQLIAQHRMQREHRVWAFLQKKLGNRKSAELQKEVDATAQAVATEAEAANDNTKGEKPNYKAFCASFATSFGSVMSAFPNGMTEATVPHYFTPTQVAALNDFMSTNIVPPNLFHQASGPKLTAQHRILLAGVILAKGKLPPELYGKGNERRDKFDDDGKAREGDGRLHATSCGTWAQQVSLYAGAGIAKYNQQDPQTVDSGGTLHLGNAETEKTFGSHDDNTGLQLQGGQKAAKEAQDKKEAEGRAKAEAAGEEYVPKNHQEFSRKAEMGAAAFDALRPGDWIYIYNANSSATGQHSEIFIGWADDAIHTDKTSGVKYKTANVMSQLHVEDGGKIHKQKLGAAYAPGIATVTAITRVTADSAELQDVRSLVASDAVEQNAKILEDSGLDGAELHHKLVGIANKELSTLVAKKLDPKQEELFRKAIDEASAAYSPESLALLIACVQRLDLKTGGVFTGRPATGIIDGPILGKGAKKKKKK